MSARETPSPHDEIPAAIDTAASEWLVRRDRGLAADEQDAYLQWLAADPRHSEALARHARALERMMQLHEWTPAGGMEKPNPDLFAPPSRTRHWRRWVGSHPWQSWTGGLGLAAAAIALLLWTGGDSETAHDAPAMAAASAPASFLHVNERQALPDGSRIELNAGADVVVLYSATERRVRLTGGEAHFTVWKDATRPFVVEAPGVEVVAVGTAFNVRLAPDNIEVLVTEGRVKVQDGPTEETRAVAPPRTEVAGLDLMVSRGERAIVPRVRWDRESVVPQVKAVSVAQIAAELAWQAPRLQFDETRLADAVAEFNRLNRHQLELRGADLGELRIGGNFRPDNVDAFVRLLGLTFDVEARELSADRTVLSRRR
ncbi:FecR family protein [Synoicihabitans lomoniglobus]|uniref:FecR domain-containing protein n=1 Tax=Synoicihabitans lomoniglobus TaxID=2909285 RepID=A0AAE9ZUG4_9BACT|nr:FecR domain-containing protein [Opitutaceae bacterium LMO-M01]WED64317.1 FecR domain-containing protein [Opitutaceae bacterium LMO-M01]